MGVYIKGMKMPTSCWDCEFERPTIDHYECCILTKKSYSWGLTKPPSDCPLIEVPTHGALIDRDDFFAICPELVNGYKTITDDCVVIPAEEGEQ